MSFLEKENHNELSRVIVYPRLIFTILAFYPKAVDFLIRQVFWLVLLKVILPKLLQWIWL